MSRRVFVTAPARLHLGMFSFGRRDVREFGGVGIMVESPETRVEIMAAERFATTGPSGERVRGMAQRIVSCGLLPEIPKCTVCVVETPPPHVGLGSGTQLGLAVARGLLAFVGVSSPPAIELAHRLGRARRSAVGSYGFDQGGLIVEAGTYAGEVHSPLVARVGLPADWRFVLLLPRGAVGLSGQDEERAFDLLPPVPEETTDRLCRQAILELLPAAQKGDFDRFSESLYCFGQFAGSCFAAAQGGAFASAGVERLVESIRGLGVRGVAQSSWGPTVFAVLRSEHEAKVLASAIKHSAPAHKFDLLVTGSNNRGATVES